MRQHSPTTKIHTQFTEEYVDKTERQEASPITDRINEGTHIIIRNEHTCPSTSDHLAGDIDTATEDAEDG